MDLIKDPQSAVGKLPSEYLFPVFAYIPVEITAIRPRQATGEGRLADLPGPSDENHLSRQIMADLGGKVTGDNSHDASIRLFSTTIKNTHGYFLLLWNIAVRVLTLTPNSTELSLNFI